MAKRIIRKRQAKSASTCRGHDGKDVMPCTEACNSVNVKSSSSHEDESERACTKNEDKQPERDAVHNDAVENQAAPSCTPQDCMTDEDFIEGIVTAVEAEDIHFLVQIDFCIRPHLVEKIPDMEKLIVFLSTNLGTEHKLKAILLIKTLLRSAELNDPRALISNLKAVSVEYEKLFYLKGKIEFMKRRLRIKDQEPESVVRE